MTVLVIRHAIAENRKTFAERTQSGGDGLRPLTKDGRRRMRRGARGISRLVPKVDVLAASGLKRAQETAAIVAPRYPKAKVVKLAELSPIKSVKQVLGWLQTQRPDATVALIGHEPQLSTFVSWAMTGLQESVIELKKGGACLIRFDGDIKAARAKLLWSMRPSQLRELAAAKKE